MTLISRIKNLVPLAQWHLISLEILQRESGLNDAHGPSRLAILFLGADAIATYDALFCQGDGTRSPYVVVLQDHGFGGNYDSFGEGGTLEQAFRLFLRKGSELRYKPIEPIIIRNPLVVDPDDHVAKAATLMLYARPKLSFGSSIIVSRHAIVLSTYTMP